MTTEEIAIALLLAPPGDSYHVPDTYSSVELDDFHSSVMEEIKTHFRSFPTRNSAENLARVCLYILLRRIYDRVSLFIYLLLFFSVLIFILILSYYIFFILFYFFF
ncbi:hypothetical protein VP01_7984g1 [Puccinia sorghi]|uniref:Uncharacterized protein n=1 Tax=Puccinia sorghi TaxID=27349 RepID=A0A0L6UAR5_9BASI|nr:hypothetical protein VP01_7984g1 [Puccinia sorghi]